jgi:hypothetical protein
MTNRYVKPEYDKVRAGEIIDIDGDCWFVNRVIYHEDGGDPFTSRVEGVARSTDVPALQLDLLKVTTDA